MNDMDIGAAFGILWVFFWSAVIFIVFVVVISIYTAYVEHFLKIPDDKKEKDNGG